MESVASTAQHIRGLAWSDGPHQHFAGGADQIAVACPFCRVRLSDALTSQQAAGSAPGSVEVVDVAWMLLAAVRRGARLPHPLRA